LDRQNAFDLLCEFTKGDGLIKHALAVEACMRAYAEKFGEEVEKWGIVGFLHDFDYEMYPTAPDHPAKGSGILREKGYPDEIIYAICSHADYMNCPRQSPLDKTLYACDELAGLITAAALVRPDKRIQGMEARSVRKKMKDKAFARSVSREDIIRGAADLGIDLDRHIDFCIRAIEKVASSLGL
jgi:putative nucleotidyltransferase with HDIG domain